MHSACSSDLSFHDISETAGKVSNSPRCVYRDEAPLASRIQNCEFSGSLCGSSCHIAQRGTLKGVLPLGNGGESGTDFPCDRWNSETSETRGIDEKVGWFQNPLSGRSGGSRPAWFPVTLPCDFLPVSVLNGTLMGDSKNSPWAQIRKDRSTEAAIIAIAVPLA